MMIPSAPFGDRPISSVHENRTLLCKPVRSMSWPAEWKKSQSPQSALGCLHCLALPSESRRSVSLNSLLTMEPAISRAESRGDLYIPETSVKSTAELRRELKALGNSSIKRAWLTVADKIRAPEINVAAMESLHALEEDLAQTFVGTFPALHDTGNLAAQVEVYYQRFQQATGAWKGAVFKFRNPEVAPVYRAFESLIAVAKSDASDFLKVCGAFFVLVDRADEFNRLYAGSGKFISERQWMALLRGRLGAIERALLPVLRTWLCTGQLYSPDDSAILHEELVGEEYWPLNYRWLCGYVSRFLRLADIGDSTCSVEILQITQRLIAFRDAVGELNGTYDAIQKASADLWSALSEYQGNYRTWLIDILRQQHQNAHPHILHDAGVPFVMRQLIMRGVSKDDIVYHPKTYDKLLQALLAMSVGGVTGHIAVLHELYQNYPHLISFSLVRDYLILWNATQYNSDICGSQEEQQRMAFARLQDPVLTSSALFETCKKAVMQQLKKTRLQSLDSNPITEYDIIEAMYGKDERTPLFTYLSIWQEALTTAARDPSFLSFLYVMIDYAASFDTFRADNLHEIEMIQEVSFWEESGKLDGMTYQATSLIRQLVDGEERAAAIEALFKQMHVDRAGDRNIWLQRSSDAMGELQLISRYYLRSYLYDMCDIKDSSSFDQFVKLSRENDKVPFACVNS